MRMRREPPGGPPPGDLDELLRPTVAERRPNEARPGTLPWRLGSQFYVAFFGGAAGAAIVAWRNASRLGLASSQRWTIAALGALGVLAAALVVTLVGSDDDGGTTTARVAGQVVSITAWGGMYLVQRTADRVHAFHSRDGEPYGSMWGPGFGAVVAGVLVQLVVIGVFLGSST